MEIDWAKDRPGGPDMAMANAARGAGPEIAVALLTGGGDRPYVFGLTTMLVAKGATVDLIGSDDLDLPAFRNQPAINFLNLRGSHRSDVGWRQKVFRVARYYGRLMGYAASARPRIFHILWNNKFELFDRTLLMLYYRLLGKKIVLTVHNVNAGRRDLRDSRLNRLTLRLQYRLAHHSFVHTEKMKRELMEEFGVPSARATVIPFGINNAVPHTALTPGEAKRRLGLGEGEKAILFFGRITPYKGLEYLIAALREIWGRGGDHRLIVAGRVDRCESYWAGVRENIREEVERGQILLRADFIPDEDTEIYFKAADALVLPYRHIYQSGVLFLGHSFGLPVLAADVGSLKDDIVEGRTGFLFRPEDAADLARTIEKYFASELFLNLLARRREIREYSAERHSWDVVGDATIGVYASLLRLPAPQPVKREAASASWDVKAPW